MSDTRQAVLECLAAALPDVPPGDLPTASKDSVEGWDSLAMLTLTALLEERLGIEVTPDNLGEFVSYERICAYVDRAGGAS